MLYNVSYGTTWTRHISFSVEDSGNRAYCTLLLLLSVSDSEARALRDHRDAGLHGTVTNISQLPRATGKRCKMALHVGARSFMKL